MFKIQWEDLTMCPIIFFTQVGYPTYSILLEPWNVTVMNKVMNINKILPLMTWCDILFFNFFYRVSQKPNLPQQQRLPPTEQRHKKWWSIGRSQLRVVVTGMPPSKYIFLYLFKPNIWLKDSNAFKIHSLNSSSFFWTKWMIHSTNPSSKLFSVTLLK